MNGRRCVRCDKPITDENRRKFCSDACADATARARLKLRKAILGTAHKIRWVRHTPG